MPFASLAFFPAIFEVLGNIAEHLRQLQKVERAVRNGFWLASEAVQD